MRFVLVVAAALVLGAVVLKTDQARQAPVVTPVIPPIIIDVVAQDASGRPIDALQPSDFSIAGPAAALSVEAVRFVRVNGAAATTGDPLPPIASREDEHAAVNELTRLFAIVLDEFHVTPGAPADRVRDALLRFVREDLGTADLLVVAKPLDSRLEIRLSRDRAAALRVIEGFEPRRGDYAPRTSFERTFIAAAPARIDSTRAQITTSLLEALATHLGRFAPARKTLIVVSEGFVRGRHRGDGLLPGVDSVELAANRAGVSIYPVDPLDAGSAASDNTPGPQSQPRPRDVFRSLADTTGGRAISAADVGRGLRRAVADASAYYVLTLTPAVTAPAINDGRVHPVDVSVRRPGVNVRARKGYWVALAQDRDAEAFHASVALPFAAQFPRRTSPLIRPWFGMARAAGGGTRVSFAWEPAPSVPGERRKGPALSRVVLSVTKMDGTPVFDGVVLPSGVVVASSLTDQRARVSFNAPVGRLLVQMRIEDVASSVVDRDVRDLVARDFSGPVTIGSPEILRARNSLELRTLTGDAGAPPVASRQFSRSEHLIVRASASSISGSPTVTARLVSTIGGTMRALAVAALPSRPSEYQTDVPLAGLAAGTYSVEITATTTDGEARESVTFRVTP